MTLPRFERVRTFHGPGRVLLEPTGDGTGYRPFHGIISSGLRASGLPGVTALSWPAVTGGLDRALDGDAEAAAALPAGVLAAATANGVLSFAGSLRWARAYVEDHLTDVWRRARPPVPIEDCAAVDLWNVKEGHTSSVWQVTCIGPQGEPLLRFALNVARDSQAGAELLRASTVLTRLAERDPDGDTVAKVYDRRWLEGDGCGVAVLVQRWAEDARELGLSPTGNGGNRVVAIEQFLNSATEPARVTGVLGRALSVEETLTLARAMTSIVLRGASWNSGADQVLLPSFDLREGDWVWTRDRACLVAVDADPTCHPTAEALGVVMCGFVDRYDLRASAAAVVSAVSAAARAELPRAGAALSWSEWAARARAVSAERWQTLGLPSAARVDWRALVDGGHSSGTS